MSRAERKLQTRRRITDAAGELFRSSGYAGVGVDGLAKAAGVTSGAFYVHFSSKADAFHQALDSAIAEVDDAIKALQASAAKQQWWSNFVEFYLGERRRAELAHSCGLQTLAPEVARSDHATQERFEAGLRRIAETIAGGPRSKGAPRTPEHAFAALGALVGAVTLARAVSDEALADAIADAARRSLT